MKDLDLDLFVLKHNIFNKSQVKRARYFTFSGVQPNSVGRPAESENKFNLNKSDCYAGMDECELCLEVCRATSVKVLGKM